MLNYNELIRLSAEHGLINNPEVWFKYRYYRNLTSIPMIRIKLKKFFSN